MPGAELVDPVAYASWWPWVALGIVVAVVAYYVWAVRSTRAPAPTPAPTPLAASAPPAPASRRDPYGALRGTALARLDEVERRYRAGEVDERGAHLEIRYAVREFATGRTGVDTSAMTAAAARADRRTRRLASLLENSSVPTFGATSRTRVSRSLEQARKQVRTW
ncbi:hypothetical protein [Cellulomonas wangsupingiae]|uniref:DUF4129 domain-containing protein n=1 Tax=Cellulomonas wangsupingiae TaxID=2968085 RepID=A0ABY5K696_9CELL|nr:hypothetical protein [Cellulomonas wangsupingiae]MCC2336450.1 hypothetical protein [Cellulomonas wangsupingiae]MCM0640860.1 hypothetical protein [Cellulomonas wangsupingiae]UUI64672.1 hypothetical protein NP075_16360 [Cellulomonas wangsupingiae]